jgi:hypothetical protein
MNEGNVHKGCNSLNGGRIEVHNEGRSGCLSAITEDLKDGDDVHVRENRQFTIDKLQEVFPNVL